MQSLENKKDLLKIAEDLRKQHFCATAQFFLKFAFPAFLLATLLADSFSFNFDLQPLSTGLILLAAVCSYLVSFFYKRSWLQKTPDMPILFCVFCFCSFILLQVVYSGDASSTYLSAYLLLQISLFIFPLKKSTLFASQSLLLGFLFFTLWYLLPETLFSLQSTWWLERLVWFLIVSMIYLGQEKTRQQLSAQIFKTQSDLNKQKEELQQKTYKLANLESSNRLQKALVSTTRMLAHDMRKPFTLARSGLALLKNKKDTEYRDKIIAMMDRDMTRSLTIVEGMLDDLSTFGIEVKLKEKEVSLNLIIQNCLIQASQLFPNSKHMIDLNLHHLKQVKVDEQRIQRVIMNLLTNALEASKKKQTIHITTSQLNDKIQFKIRNVGSSIAMNKIDKIFEPFFTEGKKKGTGLGLPIAQKFLKAHGSNLKCSSSTQPEYVEFAFELPISEQLENLETPSTNSLNLFKKSSTQANQFDKSNNKAGSLNTLEAKVKTKGQPLNVAVVDDEETARKSLQSLFSDSQIDSLLHSEYFNNSHSLLNTSYNKLDCLILDVDLREKEEDGISLTKKLRANGFAGTICLHTNSMDPKTQVDGIQAGADLVMAKPMTKAHLIRILGIEH